MVFSQQQWRVSSAPMELGVWHQLPSLSQASLARCEIFGKKTERNRWIYMRLPTLWLYAKTFHFDPWLVAFRWRTSKDMTNRPRQMLIWVVWPHCKLPCNIWLGMLLILYIQSWGWFMGQCKAYFINLSSPFSTVVIWLIANVAVM